MDYSGLIIAAAIVVWAAFEYNRREQDHKEIMAYLRKGLDLPELSLIPSAWRLRTTGAVALILLLLISGLFMLGAKSLAPYGKLFVVLAIPFSGIFVLLVLIFLRDYRLRRSLSDQKGESL